MLGDDFLQTEIWVSQCLWAVVSMLFRKHCPISVKRRTGEQAGLTLFIRTNSSWQLVDLMVLTRMEHEGMWEHLC